MRLKENPIFITHQRIVHRGGVAAAVLMAVLVGACLLLGLSGSLHDQFSSQHTPQESGRIFYGWTIAVEILVLVIGGFSRIARALADDRKAGLWDSNRLTPLKPAEIIAGYWFGPALREFYMALVLAGFGLLITLTGRLPVTLWLETQILIASTALFFGLLGVLAGMAVQRSQGIIVVLACVLAYPFVCMAPSRMVTNFLLPIYGIGHLFADGPASGTDSSDMSWSRSPEIFGLPVPPILLSLGLQFIIGIFVWRSLVRKTANPFQPLLLRWEAVVLFSILLVAQHALLWDFWRGKFPMQAGRGGQFHYDEPLLQMVQCGILVVGVILLAFASPQPEQVRLESLRLGFKNLGAVFSRSAVSLALALAGIAGLTLATQFMFAPAASWRIVLVAIVNLAEIFLAFALLLEFCRLRHRRRALGFVIFWLFLLCAVPLILAGVFSSDEFVKVSLLAPGIYAIADGNDSAWSLLFTCLVVHFGVVVVLFAGWWRQWSKLLGKTS